MTMLEAEDRRRYLAAQVRLFAYMSERGIRRTWLARRLGCSRQLIYYYEHHGALPLVRFEESCRALEVPPERFGWRVSSAARRAEVERAS